MNSLFQLIVRNGLEIKNYYSKLYVMVKEITQTPKSGEERVHIFGSKYSAKFKKLLEVSLRSSKLSATIVAAFLKVLSRITLCIESAETLWITGLIVNLIKKYLYHPNSISLQKGILFATK
eukprot:TRINITY_DN5011_c0_g1_i7.p1 TRINITY_DN5011_c0_g1~~TRINITY_DN5011_c0_g1_i7.p1  ORF type:complete len:121 (-),score=26.93 TRINITY_DN5011_c0_g1_i7:383-745(-)